ncbi:MAG: methanol--corrinoid methyltransferase, partial [archaeon]|nr:methanol--corrinoid methyltransferase [archaeon]
IGQAIVANGDDYYTRSKAAALKAIEIINRGFESKELQLTVKQKDVLDDCKKKIEALPAETDKFLEQCHKEYDGHVPNYNLKNYGL